jgi:Family of unknown function (DUF6491)
MKFAKSFFRSALAAAAVLLAPRAALANEAPADPLAEAGYVVVEPDARISALRHVTGFEVLSDNQLILRAGASRLYRAQLGGTCGRGLRFEWRLGLNTWGGEVSRFSDVIVDGRRCPIRALDRVERRKPPASPGVNQ